MTFTVVIPLFNKAATVGRCLRSVLSQELPPGVRAVEIIVVDDGSTDGGVCDLPTEILATCRVIRTKNQGVSSARNLGAREASGELIAFLDADDELMPGALVAFANLSFEWPTAGYLSGAHEKVSEEGFRYVPTGAWSVDRKELVEDFFREYRRNRALINSSSVCIRREEFLASGGFPDGEPLGEDVYLWMRLALQTKLAHTGQRVSCVYRDAENRTPSRAGAVVAVPYFLRYFLTHQRGLSWYRRVPSLRSLLLHLAIMNLLGAAIDGQRERADEIVKLFGVSPSHRLLLRLVGLVPVSLIVALRRLRFRLGGVSGFSGGRGRQRA